MYIEFAIDTISQRAASLNIAGITCSTAKTNWHCNLLFNTSVTEVKT